MIRLFFVFLFSMGISASADDVWLETVKSGKSTIMIEHIMNDKGVALIFLKNEKGEREFLYEHGRSATVLLSPDFQYLALNDAGGSDFTNLYIFKKISGLKYTRLDTDVNSAVMDYYNKITGKSKTYHHLYIEALSWIDAHSVMIEIGGYGSPDRTIVSGFKCIYDVNKREFRAFQPEEKR